MPLDPKGRELTPEEAKERLAELQAEAERFAGFADPFGELAAMREEDARRAREGNPPIHPGSSGDRIRGRIRIGLTPKAAREAVKRCREQRVVRSAK